ncbi:MAG: hypothetical protein ABSD20_04440 [Terriglobales bacterium]|jgi:hypothetical protein
MSDALFLSLWFPNFEPAEILPRTLSVLRQFPYSAQRPGISYLAIHPVNWSEATVLERRFQPGIEPEAAVEIAAEFAQPDYAYLFECHWDLWMPQEKEEDEGAGKDVPVLHPMLVKLVARGPDFDDQAYQQEGHVEVDLGLDDPFLYENEHWTPIVENQFRANVQQLVSFTQAVEKNCGISGRVLWSESDENLARKLIERLQHAH